MNVQDQIGKLESLLDTIRRNAQKPRASQGGTLENLSPESVRTDVSATAPMSRTPEQVPPPVVAASPSPEVDVEVSTEIEVLDMSETEILEVSAEEAGMTVVGEEVLEADLGEPVPESAPRPAVQTVEREIEREPPVKTPPPESGRQAVTPIPGSPYADIAEPGVGRSTVKSAIVEADLQEAPELEILESPAGAVSAEPLEASQPSPPQPAVVRAPRRPEPTPQAPGPITVARPDMADVSAAEIVSARPARLPETFLELLDASLRLRA